MGKCQCLLSNVKSSLLLLKHPYTALQKEKSKTLRNVPSLFWTACVLQQNLVGKACPVYLAHQLSPKHE